MTEIVAEISGNHSGSLNNALRLIEEAKRAGADAVKFQCFDPERLAARRAKNPEVLALAGGASLLQLYRETHTPRHWFDHMTGAARELRLAWFSSVFDPADVAFLETLDCPRYKISAFEMLDWDIIKAVKETGKPIVMSVRPTSGVTILAATDYTGQTASLGLSAHAAITPSRRAPMVEYHLKLDDIDTVDSGFSLTPEALRGMVRVIRSGS
jgi:N-acetylneuraminate synthase